MNFKSLVSIALLIPSIVFANDFVIKNVKNDSFKESDFPFFSSKKYPKSANSINELIQFDFFGQFYKESAFSDNKLSPFSDYSKIKAYIYEYDVKKETNYITLSISAEACGAYCEGFVNKYIFDVYTGKRISLVDLLSPIGAKHLEMKIREMNRKRIKPFIKNPPLPSADEYDNERYHIYLYCYESRFIEYPSSYHKVDANTSFSIDNNTLTITNGRCSNHASRGLDDIGRFVNKFTFKELENYFSVDAKKYLSDKPHQLSEFKTSYQVFHGKIAGKYPITIIRQKYGGWVYWYDKYKKEIDLNSAKTNEDNTYILQEGYHDGRSKWIYTSEFRVTENNGVFKGVFVNLKNGKEMSVEFQ